MVFLLCFDDRPLSPKQETSAAARTPAEERKQSSARGTGFGRLSTLIDFGESFTLAGVSSWFGVEPSDS
jgi:hypothetical protein